MVESSHPCGSDPDRITPTVLMISVDWVQPSGLTASDAASWRIAVAPFGKILSRAATWFDIELLQNFRNMNAGRRRLGIRDKDRIGREKCVAQRSGIANRYNRVSNADGNRSFNQADV